MQDYSVAFDLKKCGKLTSKFLWLVLAIMIAGCSLETGPADKTYTAISLAEVARLVPYTICLPSYLPEGVVSPPNVVYHAEMGDPQDADVRLRYHQANEPTPIVEIFQKVSSIDLESYNTSEYGGRHVSESNLIYWAVDESVSPAVKSSMTVSTTEYVDDLKRWAFEITRSEPMQANMIAWTDDHKYYQVYTRLPLDEAKRIALSMEDCLAAFTVTPSGK